MFQQLFLWTCQQIPSTSSISLYKRKAVDGGQHAHRSALLVASGARLALEPLPRTVCLCYFVSLSKFPLIPVLYLPRGEEMCLVLALSCLQWGHRKQSCLSWPLVPFPFWNVGTCEAAWSAPLPSFSLREVIESHRKYIFKNKRPILF